MNPELEQILSRAQTLYEDVDYKAVAEWKSGAPGRKAIGYMPIYVPRELIHAAGMLPVGIFGGGDRLEIIRGDAYFQSYICHIPRSTIELALSGRLDGLDGTLFKRLPNFPLIIRGTATLPASNESNPMDAADGFQPRRIHSVMLTFKP